MYALKIFSDVLKERIFILVKGAKWTNFIKEAYGAMYWRFFVCEKGGLQYDYIIYNNIRAKLQRKRAVEEGEGEKAVKKQGKNTGKPLEKHAPIKKQKKN